jgi:hypothetical protein
MTRGYPGIGCDKTVHKPVDLGAVGVAYGARGSVVKHMVRLDR